MRCLCLAAVVGTCLAALAVPAQGALIQGGVTGPGMVVQDYTGTSYQPDGRQAYKSFDSNLNSTSPPTMWLTQQVPTLAVPVSITYNFNTLWQLGSMNVWNYNETSFTGRGFKDVTIWLSGDYGQTWTQMAATTLNQAPGSTSYNTPDTISFGGSYATNLRITATSNYGASGYSGLNDVQITGTRQQSLALLGAASVTTSSFYPGRSGMNTVDGFRYDNDYNHMWLSNLETSPTIQWDLGSVRQLHHMNIFNYNEPGVTDRGLQSAKLEYSTDGVTWTQVGSTNITIPRAKGTNDSPGATFLLGGGAAVPARYVRMTNVTNYGNAYAGLQEVEFYATAPSNWIDIRTNHPNEAATRYIHAVNGSQYLTNAPGTYDGTIFIEQRPASSLLTGEGPAPITLLADGSGKLYQRHSSATPGYFNFNGNVSGMGGLLVDLGDVYILDALQLYGYNISDSGTVWFNRSLKDFTLWTATDPSAVQITGDKLFVSDLSKFTQQGGLQTLGALNPASPDTYGETFLFGGAAQPADVAGPTHLVTPGQFAARYLFFRDMTAQVVGAGTGNDGEIGLGEIRFYGVAVPEPSSLTILLLGLCTVAPLAWRRRPNSAGSQSARPTGG